MGCCNARKFHQNKFEEDFFYSFEQNLGFKDRNVNEIFTSFSKYSKNLHLTYFQVSQIYESLSLPFQEYIEFFDQFDRNRSSTLSEKKFSYLQLQSLNILLSKGEPKKKLQYLFDMYDTGSLKVISHMKVQQLLENLLKVALDYIPTYFIIKNQDQVSVSEYKNILKNSSDYFIDKISSKLMRNRGFICFFEFLNNALRAFGADLVSTKFLREKAYQLGLSEKKKKIRKKNNGDEKKEQSILLDDFSEISFDLVNINKTDNLHKKTTSDNFYAFGHHISEDGMDSDKFIYSTDSKTMKYKNVRINSYTNRHCSIIEVKNSKKDSAFNEFMKRPEGINKREDLMLTSQFTQKDLDN